MSPLDHYGALEKTRKTRAPFEMTNNGLYRSNVERVSRAGNMSAETVMDGGSFSWISCLGSGPMSFKELLCISYQRIHFHDP